MATAATKKGIKAKEGQPANFYCISCIQHLPVMAAESLMANLLFPNYWRKDVDAC